MQGELILERYRLISQVGAGGFATVQLAWDTRIQRRVAIKCLSLDGRAAALVAGQDDVSAYDAANVPGLEEARTAAMLQDPNIAMVYDFEMCDGVAYLIMEYVDGITLSKLMDDFGDKITPNVVAAVFAGVAHALEIAHGNQVLHLDIKPDNVIINHQGQVKVTDFGLAKLSSGAGFSKAAGGTIGYMPLEQMRQESLDARCDEWSLASITYEMIAGENPFVASDLEHAPAVIENAEIVPPSLCMPELDDEIDDVLLFALHPVREERYDTVREFADEMLPLLGSVKRGGAELAAIVGNAVDDAEETDDEETLEMSGLTQQLNKIGGFEGGRGGRRVSHVAIMRLWSLVNSLLIVFVGCAAMSWLDAYPPYVRGIAIAIVCVLSLVVPHAAALAALLLLALAFLSQGALLCGGLMALVSIIWWGGMGRNSANEPNAMLSASTFGAFGCGSVSPLLSGLYLKPASAVLNTVASAVLAAVLSTMGTLQLTGWRAFGVLPSLMKHVTEGAGQTAVLPACDQMIVNLVITPAFWITLACWVLAALACAAISGHGGVTGRIFGVLAGACIIAGGLVLQAYVSTSGTSYMPGQAAILVALAVTGIGLAFAILDA